MTLNRAKQTAALALLGDTYLQNLITAASQFAIDYCGRNFASTERTQLYDGQGTDELLVKDTPVTAWGAVVVTDQWAGDSETYSSSDFISDLNIGLLKFAPTITNGQSRYFVQGIQNVSVTYTAGYSTIPESLQQAVCDLILAMSTMTAYTGNPAMQAERMGEYNYSQRIPNTSTAELSTSIPASVRAAFAPYRRAMTVQ